MNIAISFTATLHDLHAGRVTLAEIEEFHVGCQREHLFPENRLLVPHEVTWLNKTKKVTHGEVGNEVDPNLCEDDAYYTWNFMRHWIDFMESHGKIKYQVGNYHELAKKLLEEGHRVWYSGEWLPKDRYEYKSERQVVKTQ
jgi:hypothetical protein